MTRAQRTVPRGFAALAFVLVLLFTMSLALLWSGRSLLFEQRAAANQQRQAVAFAAAESGLEWARARLNEARAVDAQCLAVAAGTTFRDRFAAPWVAAPWVTAAVPESDAAQPMRSGYAPPAGLRARCRVEPAALVCQCAAASSWAGTDDRPSFTVELSAVADEGRALWLVARGCSGGSEACASAATAQTDAQAVVRVKLRLAVAASTRLHEEAEALRHGALVVAPGSWRDGRCASASDDVCGFEP